MPCVFSDLGSSLGQSWYEFGCEDGGFLHVGLAPGISDKIDYEAELAVVIGRGGNPNGARTYSLVDPWFWYNKVLCTSLPTVSTRGGVYFVTSGNIRFGSVSYVSHSH